ncbi:MAG: HAMP domain-containing sensor histidine kinase [[Clostridium] aminophilum]|uniref:sensor histidine kinase n=1 Tax=[Clostridium] aminophilum TaxID=1526 RepID=UPI0026ED01E9|nr:HAMP domain-containing sensor histidine kinase [[Clostridium] aminophilum]MDD6195702.1 HAMP domain-containing sensor histidine kinase [[Clostridium] aminophilum]
MFHSLYSKLFWGYLIFAVLGFLTIATFSAGITHRYMVKSSADSIYREATMIADNLSSTYRGKVLNPADTYPRLEASAALHQSEVWIIDRNGRITADSGRKREGTTVSAFDPTTKGSNIYSVGNFYGTFPYEVLSVAAPITGNMQTFGYVVIHVPMSDVLYRENQYMAIVYITGVVLFLLSFILLFIVARYVVRPLHQITDAAKQYAAGDLRVNIPVKSRDEVGYLADTLNTMSDQIADVEDYQKKFIANVSHDFRSPLTSIKGYLEAILDGTIPPELHEKYLTLIINETKRLTKLTEGMLTLNSLDSKNCINRSNFDINRTIKDTAASFEGTCRGKGITFDLTFGTELEMVNADLGKIQQVLYNLIDNAIKFSHDNSVIEIAVVERNEKYFISVKDSGIGIPKKSLSRIWERFYKSDLSRGKDKKGTGLGLSIVKEIIQSHGENIDVVSTEGVGTEFTFSLPKAKMPGKNA